MSRSHAAYCLLQLLIFTSYCNCDDRSMSVMRGCTLAIGMLMSLPEQGMGDMRADPNTGFPTARWEEVVRTKCYRDPTSNELSTHRHPPYPVTSFPSRPLELFGIRVRIKTLRRLMNIGILNNCRQRCEISFSSSNGEKTAYTVAPIGRLAPDSLHEGIEGTWRVNPLQNWVLTSLLWGRNKKWRSDSMHRERPFCIVLRFLLE
jgi:hypothetical protein